MGYGQKTNTPKTGAERFMKFARSRRTIECPDPADMRRRKRLEKDPPKWLQHYMAQSYPFPFSAGHIRLIDSIIEAAETGEGTATAQPRGEGKSSVCRGMGFYLQSLKVVRFPVLVGWKHMDAGAAFQMWLRMLSSSPEFAADYPEIATPFAYSIHKTALANLVWGNTIKNLGVIEGEKTGATVDTMHKVIQLPNNIGAIAARSAKGDAKGLNATLKDGTILRPDFLLIDDAQDVSKAANPEQVSKTIDTLENVFFGMAGPQKRLSAAVACTVEAEDDVSEHWLTKRGWKHIKVSRVEVWPDGKTGGTWDTKKGCKIRAAWDEWREIYLESGQTEANAFYEANRNMMTGQMRVSWEHRYEQGKDVCAIDAAMHDWYTLGEDVFARGQQNQPLKINTAIYNINPKIIMEKTTDRKPGVIPDTAQKVVVAIDVNYSIGLTWAAVAFGSGLAHVIDYGIREMSLSQELPEQELARTVYEELIKHGRELAAKPYQTNLAVFDIRGWNYESAYNLSSIGSRATGLPMIGCMGFGAKQFRPSYKTTGRKGSYWHETTDAKNRTYIACCSDFWREIAQKAWLGSLGSPGGIDLPQGYHKEFAEQICREPMLSKIETPLGLRWEYATLPGNHDFGDVMHMAFMGADFLGMGTGGTVIKRKKYIERRKPKIKGMR